MTSDFLRNYPSSRNLGRNWRAFLRAGAVVFALGFPSTASAQLQWGTGGAGGSGTWSTTPSNTDWYNGTANVAWDSNVANFGGTAGTVTLGSNVSATGLTFNTTGYTIAGAGFTLGLTGTPTVSINSATGTTFTAVINANINTASGVTTSFTANVPAASAVTYTLGGTNTFTGGVNFASGSALAFSSSTTAVTYLLNAATTNTTTAGAAVDTFTGGLSLTGENLILSLGNATATATGGNIVSTTIAGGSIFVNTTGTVIQAAKTAAGGLVTINNAIGLNASNVTQPFQTAFGATKPTATVTSYATNDNLVIAGNITGASDVYITTSISAGGGAGGVTFSGNNSYTGKTVVDLTGTSGAFILGSSTALPATTALVFGHSVTSSNGVAPLDLNGFSTTIASLATDTTNSAVISIHTGITNSQSNLVTVKIVGSASTTFSGSIGALNSGTAGVVTGTNNIALSLGTGNSGTLTLIPNGTTQTNANTYTGGTTISGGTLQTGFANAVPSGGLTLIGGTFGTSNPAVATTGFSDALGNLTVSAASTIALGTSNHALTFTGLTLSGTPGLTITGWNGTPGIASTTSTNSGVLLFATTGTNLSSASQANSAFASLLSQTTFSPYATGATFIADTYNGVSYLELQPVPEPGSIMAIGTALFGSAVCLRRRNCKVA